MAAVAYHATGVAVHCSRCGLVSEYGEQYQRAKGSAAVANCSDESIAM